MSHLFSGVFAGEHCYNWYYSETYYCEWGCCGDDVDRGCCSMAGLIVGCCLAGIAVIAFIVAVICCCIKHKGKPGRVIGTSTVTTTTTTTTQRKYYRHTVITPPPPSNNHHITTVTAGVGL